MDAWIVIGLLALVVIAFATEKISVDMVTLGLLCALVLFGILRVDQAFSGFGDHVIILLASIFVIGAALRDTGVLDTLGSVLATKLGNRPTLIVSGLMIVVAVMSAFMNNTTVTAVFLGPVISMARRVKMSPSRLLMPMAFASIMGGTCTLIGTSTNVAVSGAMDKLGMQPLGMFEFSKVGCVMVVAGIAYIILIGARMIPESARDSKAETDAFREYLAEVMVLPESPLIGQPVFESDFSALEFQVVKIRRRGQTLDAAVHERFEEGDVVLVAGKVENLIRVKKIEGIDILEDVTLRNSGALLDNAQVAEVVLTPRCGYVGRSMRESNFRQRTGLSVMALMRGESSLMHHMADEKLLPGDVLLVQGPAARFRDFEEGGEMVVINQHQFSVETRRKGFVLLGFFMLAIFAGSMGWVPDTIAIMMVAMMAVFLGCIKLDSAYSNIDWRLLILIGGMMGFGEAMRGSGASSMIAEAISATMEPFGVFAVFAAFCVLTAILTQPISNAAAALVMLPVALQTAAALGASQRAFAIGVMLSASCSVLTPFEPSCLLVYGPGKYRFSDFIKVGGGLTLVLLAVILIMVPIFWPLALPKD